MLEGAFSDIGKLAGEWACPLSSESLHCLGIYLEQLLAWNERVNLTGARELSDLIGDHLPDSFALARLCPSGAKLVDIGSGGGLPAIPFAILRPDCRTTLVEPRAKRIAFLNMVVRRCDLKQVKVMRARVEELNGSEYTVAASRATFKPEAWLAIAPRILRTDGLAIVFATSRDIGIPSSAKLLEGVDYSTAGGSARWCGRFCFT